VCSDQPWLLVPRPVDEELQRPLLRTLYSAVCFTVACVLCSVSACDQTVVLYNTVQRCMF
jgi:hypothetical protein